MSKKLTPMMRQYMDAKEKYPDTILFFRMGDFYEMFFDDAKTVAKLLGLTLTARGKGESRTPMCGVPHHAAENYINKLIKTGNRVAVCEQIEDPKLAKGIVKREVTQIITPGTAVSASLLDEGSNNYMAAIMPQHNSNDENTVWGISFLDLSTGKFMLTEFSGQNLLINELLRLQPSEIIVPANMDAEVLKLIKQLPTRALITRFDELFFDHDTAYSLLTAHFKVHSLDGFGCQGAKRGISCAGAIVGYLKENKLEGLAHISSLSFYSSQDVMIIDEITRRNLAIEDTKTSDGSLISVLDCTRTSIGSRNLKDWVKNPLIKTEPINQRLEAVEQLICDPVLLEELKELLGQIKDIERILGRISCNFASARDLVALKNSFQIIPDLKKVLPDQSAELIEKVRNQLCELPELVEEIDRAIVDEPPAIVRDGGFIKQGYNPELDEILDLSHNGKRWLKNFQETEIGRTGIKSLKVQYNKVFGYYIEVTKSNLAQVPETYIRKQTLVNAERFITPELKDYETKILGAEEKRKELELYLFKQLLEKICVQTNLIHQTAQAIGVLDTLYSFALVSLKNNYTKPTVDHSDRLDIQDGRHPIIEKNLEEGQFVPNNTDLDCTGKQIFIITGPNMAGKSTYIRQVALITLMAQIGIFVPATSAHIGAVDRIFTRIGAADDILKGRSTFLVEMNETALILNNATSKSLIILDEIGRGTSTFDGLSIAWAVVEHIHSSIKAKTLFATHYHELTELSSSLNGVVNYNISVKEWNDEIIFVRKIVPGGCDKSYGIHVAKLAGLPAQVIQRAFDVLNRLEGSHLATPDANAFAKTAAKPQKQEQQLSFFDPPAQVVFEKHPVVAKLENVNPVDITPMQALCLINDWKKLLTDPQK